MFCYRRFSQISIAFAYMVGLFAPYVCADVVAVFAGKDTEASHRCEIGLIDVGRQKLLFQHDCPDDLVFSMKVFEYRSDLYFVGLESDGLTGDLYQSSIHQFSLKAMDFIRSATHFGSLYVKDVDSSRGKIYLTDYDVKNDFEVDLNLPRIRYRQTDMAMKLTPSMRFLSDGRILCASGTALEFVNHPDDILAYFEGPYPGSNAYEVSNQVSSIQEYFEIDSVFGIYYGAFQKSSRIEIFSKEKRSPIVGDLATDDTTGFFVGFVDPDTLMFFNVEYYFKQKIVTLVFREYDYRSKSTRHVDKVEYPLDRFGGPLELLLSRNKRFVLIGTNHKGGQGMIEAPGELLIFDRETKKLSEFPFSSGWVRSLCILSDESEALVHKNTAQSGAEE
ncbi:MAG: hypothetical protein GC154_16700 [bacterium]|nr:hypothetical protein [bacterium]